MLVLTRRSGESVMVGDDIVVTVLDVRADTVRLGIKAPRHIAVHREEVFEEIRAANRAAASPQEESIAALRRRLRTTRAEPASTESSGASSAGPSAAAGTPPAAAPSPGAPSPGATSAGSPEGASGGPAEGPADSSS